MAIIRPSSIRILLTCLLTTLCVAALQGADKKILLIAGPPSHGPGQHEHNAGVLLLQKCLADVRGLKTEVRLGGWPQDEAVLIAVELEAAEHDRLIPILKL